MKDQTAGEIINDLIRVNNDRISRYQEIIDNHSSIDHELRVLLAQIVGESHHNKIFLATELHAMGELIDLSLAKSGYVFTQYLQQLPAESGQGRGPVLQFSDLLESAMVSACQSAQDADDVAAYLKDIILQQQNRCMQLRAEIRHLREKTT